MAKIIVSSCLLGIECRYKGDCCFSEEVAALAKKHTLIGICPEQMGGLTTPRAPSERKGDRVISNKGADVTREFQRGAEEALKIAKLNRAKYAVLKADSPSCGCGVIYDGTFSGAKVAGDGVTTELFKRNGIKVFTENDKDAWPFKAE